MSKLTKNTAKSNLPKQTNTLHNYIQKKTQSENPTNFIHSTPNPESNPLENTTNSMKSPAQPRKPKLDQIEPTETQPLEETLKRKRDSIDVSPIKERHMEDEDEESTREGDDADVIAKCGKVKVYSLGRIDFREPFYEVNRGKNFTVFPIGWTSTVEYGSMTSKEIVLYKCHILVDPETGDRPRFQVTAMDSMKTFQDTSALGVWKLIAAERFKNAWKIGLKLFRPADVDGLKEFGLHPSLRIYKTIRKMEGYDTLDHLLSKDRDFSRELKQDLKTASKPRYSQDSDEDLLGSKMTGVSNSTIYEENSFDWDYSLELMSGLKKEKVILEEEQNEIKEARRDWEEQSKIYEEEQRLVKEEIETMKLQGSKQKCEKFYNVFTRAGPQTWSNSNVLNRLMMEPMARFEIWRTMNDETGLEAKDVTECLDLFGFNREYELTTEQPESYPDVSQIKTLLEALIVCKLKKENCDDLFSLCCWSYLDPKMTVHLGKIRQLMEKIIIALGPHDSQEMFLSFNFPFTPKLISMFYNLSHDVNSFTKALAVHYFLEDYQTDDPRKIIVKFESQLGEMYETDYESLLIHMSLFEYILGDAVFIEEMEGLVDSAKKLSMVNPTLLAIRSRIYYVLFAMKNK